MQKIISLAAVLVLLFSFSATTFAAACPACGRTMKASSSNNYSHAVGSDHVHGDVVCKFKTDYALTK